MRPLIAVAAMRSPRVDGLRLDGFVASQKVIEALYRAGAEPVILPPLDTDHRPELHRYQGIVLPGGRDIHPQFYGVTASEHPEHGPFDAVHDAVDLQLAIEAVAAMIPTLAICRGLQILNVALGGTLWPDLPATNVEHGHGFHEVILTPDSMVARAIETEKPSVSTCHHQAVHALGRDLRVTGVAADGCIEAIEHRQAPILAVQWHPEDDADINPVEQALFEALVEPSRWAIPSAMTGAT
jgi:putative glutamine amidotransferase